MCLCACVYTCIHIWCHFFSLVMIIIIVMPWCLPVRMSWCLFFFFSFCSFFVRRARNFSCCWLFVASSFSLFFPLTSAHARTHCACVLACVLMPKKSIIIHIKAIARHNKMRIIIQLLLLLLLLLLLVCNYVTRFFL